MSQAPEHLDELLKAVVLVLNHVPKAKDVDDLALPVAILTTAYAQFHAEVLKQRLADAAIEIDQLKRQLAAEQASHATTRDRQGQRREG